MIANNSTSAKRQHVSDVAFTPAVKDVQSRLGSRNGYASMERGRGWADTITDDLRDFIAQRDSFYLGTASTVGQPYIQHRGGPPGFGGALFAATDHRCQKIRHPHAPGAKTWPTG